ncbi:hypothetical protein, partial [Salmonella sp. s51228]|uniref:hypothetical protein n=1 Tax=Salmonella sp. s51228 TaxID=3159652 RepID=UPI0039807B36
KSYLNKYVGADKNGKVFGDTDFDDLTPDNEFDIITQDDGKIGIRSTHGRYFNGTDDKMDCYVLDTKAHKETLWTIHLAMHPQVNLRNVNRRTYAHYVEDTEGKPSIRVNEEIP